MSNPIGSNGNLSSNPYYNGDYTLQPYSQLVDAGDPNDPYGNEPAGQGPGRIDIGRFGNTPQATTTPTSSIINGDFDSAIGRPWDHIFFTAAQGQTWDRVSGTHPGKNGLWYISTCDLVQSNGSGGCHNSPWESETHTGTMRSNRFQITGAYLKFRLAGFNGSSCTGNNNFIRLRRASNDEILFSAKPCGNTMAEVSWTVGSYLNEWVYLELVDGDSGSGYAWIAADYFRQEGAGGGGLVNGNFEAQMSGWTATGPWAINNTWPLNSGYTQVGLEGSYCAGSHNPQSGTGTLTSSPFAVNQTYLNFKVGGWHQYGGQPGFNEVRLAPSGGGSTLCSSNPTNTNDLIQKTWDLSNFQNQTVQLVAQDNHAQSGYAWMSVDAFWLSSTPATTAQVCGGGGGGSLPLTDTFDNNNISMYHPVEGSWYASSNRYVGDNVPGSQHYRSYRDAFSPNGDYNVEVEYVYEQFNIWNEAHLYIHWQDAQNYIGIRTINRSGNWRVEKFQRLNGNWTEGVMLDFSGSLSTGQTYRLKLSAQGSNVYGYVDYGSGYQGPYLLGYSSPSSGTVALGVNSCRVAFDNVHIWTGAAKDLALAAASVPDRVVLEANYPNPFNASTLIRYFLPASQPVELTLFDLLGRPVRRWTQPAPEAGWYQVLWDGEDAQGRPVGTGVHM